jgi:hypothetical protein
MTASPPRKKRASDPSPLASAPKRSFASRFEGFDRLVGMAAVWSVVFASTALNAWGWLQSTAGLVAGVIVALVIASEILGATLLARIAGAIDHRNIVRAVLALALFVGCVGFNAYSGHRALELVEIARTEPLRAAQAADAAVERIEAQIRETAPPPITDDQGRPIGPQRLAVLIAQHDAIIARLDRELQTARDVRAAIETPPAATISALDGAALWLLVGLLELIKAAALFALSRPTQRQNKRQKDPALTDPAAEPLRLEPPPRPRLVTPPLVSMGTIQTAPSMPEPMPPPQTPGPILSAAERLAAMRARREAADPPGEALPRSRARARQTTKSNTLKKDAEQIP